MMRTKILLLASAAALLAAPAFAADLPVVPIIPDVPVASDWSGAHVGIVAGWAAGEQTYDYFESSVDFDASGYIAGVGAGFDWQTGNLVMGVEGDISATGISGDVLVDGGMVEDAAPCFVEGCTVDVNALATLRGRAGVAIDGVLPYVTAGMAWGQVEGTADVEACGLGESCSFDEWTRGWTAGLGVEYAATEQLSIKAEYLRVQLDGPGTFDESVDDFPSADNLGFNLFRLGANFRF